MVPKLVTRQVAADYMKIHWCKLEYLRKKGLIPETVKVGRNFVFPLEKLDEIRARLEAAGHLKPAGVGHAVASVG